MAKQLWFPPRHGRWIKEASATCGRRDHHGVLGTAVAPGAPMTPVAPPPPRGKYANLAQSGVPVPKLSCRGSNSATGGATGLPADPRRPPVQSTTKRCPANGEPGNGVPRVRAPLWSVLQQSVFSDTLTCSTAAELTRADSRALPSALSGCGAQLGKLSTPRLLWGQGGPAPRCSPMTRRICAAVASPPQTPPVFTGKGPWWFTKNMALPEARCRSRTHCTARLPRV